MPTKKASSKKTPAAKKSEAKPVLGPQDGKYYDYECPECGFFSHAHPTAKSRDARRAQHEHEHETGEPVPEMADFLKEQ